MTSRDFCYWLQGYFEINGPEGILTEPQTEMIQKHLALVFKHEIDPSYGDEQHQQKLNEIHNQPTFPPSTRPPGKSDPGDIQIRC